MGVFLVGAVAGSFLNVVLSRLRTSFTILGRSFCFSCGKTLTWRELFPLFSFLLQRGRCRSCKVKISWQYPAVEFLTGVVFVLVFWELWNQESGIRNYGEILYVWTVMSVLVVILVYDVRHKIIPDKLAYAFAALAFVKLLLGHFLFSEPALLHWHDLLAGPILAAPLALLWLVSGGRWIGLGDAKLTLGTGWFLGLSSGLNALILAFWIGAAAGVFLLALSSLSSLGKKYGWGTKWTLKSEMPFAPFLILGFFLAFLGIEPLYAFGL